MADKNKIGGAVVVVSAGLGCIVGLIELSDRFLFPSKSEDPLVEAAQPVAPADTTVTPNPVPTPKSDAVAPATDIPGTDLERDIAARVGEVLVRFKCAAVTVTRVVATDTVTAADSTSSGFEGHFLEGSAVLAAGETPMRMRLLGTGKGPSGRLAAVDMALRGFEDEFRKTDTFKSDCEGE
ncbi:MAG: hypothetical protein AAFW87_05395 [Pseudomonadota bacterium]